jgi:hypothetical protein
VSESKGSGLDERVPLRKIVSGGQTGADRGGLDAAVALGIPHGGWCPKGRRAEDGAVPARYRLRETTSREYQPRTKANVRDSDGTVIFTSGHLEGGSRFTSETALDTGKPVLHLDHWLVAERIHTLNVAGSRGSKAKELHARVVAVLRAAVQPAEGYPAEEEALPIAAEPAEPYVGGHDVKKKK